MSASVRETGPRTASTIAGILGVIFLGLIARLYWIQVLPQEARHRAVSLQTQRSADDWTTLGEEPPRAAIFDREGRALASSWFAHDFVIDGKELVAVPAPPAGDVPAARLARSRRRAAADHAVKLVFAALADVGIPLADPARVARDLRTTIIESRSYDVVVRGLEPETRRRLQERLARGFRASVTPEGLARFRMDGFLFVKRLRRTYPFGGTLSQVVGVIGEAEGDAKGRIAGRTGFELMADGVLSGTPGRLRWERDRRGRGLLTGWNVQQAMREGAEVSLTIDAEIQEICMQALEESVKERGCARGSAVVLDVATGEILAAASWPTAEPDLGEGSDPKNLRNGAIQDVYEPGSIIKPVYLSVGLQEGDFRLDERWDCGGGKGYHTFRDGRRRRLVREYLPNPGMLTTEEVVMKSSNVGAVRILKDRMKLTRAWQAFERFGLSRFISLAYPYTERGRYTSEKLVREHPSYSALNTACSFAQGYEVTVTPLGMARMYLPFARSDGSIIEPSLVKEIRFEGRVERPTPRKRTVLNPETAHRMRRVLERVVESGTAKVMKNDRWTVAAKTGTPKKTGKDYYNPVICAIAPARQPEIVVTVIHQEVRRRKRGDPYSGGRVSGPVAKQIVERTLDYLRVPSDR